MFGLRRRQLGDVSKMLAFVDEPPTSGSHYIGRAHSRWLLLILSYGK
jgi:hypothetical protein